MGDPVGVTVGHGLKDGPTHVAGLHFTVKFLFADAIKQLSAVELFHDDKKVVRRFVELVQPNDVVVPQIQQDEQLAAQVAQIRFVQSGPGQDLDRVRLRFA